MPLFQILTFQPTKAILRIIRKGVRWIIEEKKRTLLFPTAATYILLLTF